MSCSEQMSAEPEEILYDAVHRCKALQMGGRLEPAHLPLPLAGRLMRDLCSIVFVLPGRAVRNMDRSVTARQRET